MVTICTQQQLHWKTQTFHMELLLQPASTRSVEPRPLWTTRGSSFPQTQGRCLLQLSLKGFLSPEMKQKERGQIWIWAWVNDSH